MYNHVYNRWQNNTEIVLCRQGKRGWFFSNFREKVGKKYEQVLFGSGLHHGQGKIFVKIQQKSCGMDFHPGEILKPDRATKSTGGTQCREK